MLGTRFRLDGGIKPLFQTCDCIGKQRYNTQLRKCDIIVSTHQRRVWYTGRFGH